MENFQEKIETLERAARENRATMREFFALVKELYRNPEVLRANVKRLGEINRRIFFVEHRYRVPIVLGTACELLVFIFAAWFGITHILENNLSIIAVQILTVSTLHPLSHVLMGKAMGIRFLGYYFNGPSRIEPGIKVDYASFLLRSRTERAIFFLAGIFGTIIPAFYWLAAGFVFPHATWIRLLLLGIAAALSLGEVLPLIFIRMKKPRLFGFSWYRGDLYKTFRELKY